MGYGLAAQLVRSLFCGLPRLEHRVAVFLAAADESSGKTHRDVFRYGGFLAPVDDWFNIFAPLWDTRVLKGPPRIPYFHMTALRGKHEEKWREEFHIDESEAEYRIDEAFGVIRAIPSLTPVGFRANAGHIFDVMKKKVYFRSRGSTRPFLPDHLVFSAFVFVVLEYVAAKHPEAERVDFMIEKKGDVTYQLQEFFDCVRESALFNGREQLIPLVGQLMPVDKDRVPVQAADLLLWYTQRKAANDLSQRDARRYGSICTRRGPNCEWPDNLIDELYASLLERLDEEEQRVSEVRRDDAPTAKGAALGDKGKTRRGEGSKKAET